MIEWLIEEYRTYPSEDLLRFAALKEELCARAHLLPAELRPTDEMWESMLRSLRAIYAVLDEREVPR